MFEEEKYRSLRSILRSLPGIKAKRGFEQRLFERIREIETKKGSVPSIDRLIQKERLGWLTNIFRPSLSPVLGLTVIILLVLIVYTYIDFSQKRDEISRSVTLEQTDKPDLTIYDRNDKLSADREKVVEERSLTPVGVDKEYKPGYSPQPPKTETDFGPVMEDVKRSRIEEQIIDEKTEGKMMENEISLPKEESGEKKGEDVMKKVEKKEIPETKDEEKIDKVDQEQKIAPFQYDDRKRRGENDTMKKKDSAKTKDKEKKIDKKKEPLDKLPEEKPQEPDSLK